MIPKLISHWRTELFEWNRGLCKLFWWFVAKQNLLALWWAQSLSCPSRMKCFSVQHKKKPWNTPFQLKTMFYEKHLCFLESQHQHTAVWSHLFFFGHHKTPFCALNMKNNKNKTEQWSVSPSRDGEHLYEFQEHLGNTSHFPCKAVLCCLEWSDSSVGNEEQRWENKWN